MPEELAYLWAHFHELHACRTVTGLGPTRATHLDIYAWQRNTGLRLQPWEVRVLMQLGAVWMNAMADEPQKQTKKPKGK